MKYQLTLNTLQWPRLFGLVRKEFTLIFRDKGTIALLIIMPILLLTVFGFAIDLDPKHLPTEIISYDNSPLTRAFIVNLETSRYFKILRFTHDEISVKDKLNTGQISFSITIPPHFTREFIRGRNPALLIELDGSDPGSSAGASSHIRPILDASLEQFQQHGLFSAQHPAIQRDAQLITHRLYNETNNSAFNIVPGLIGVLLTITMVMLTSTAITSEFESGTMETLLSTTLQPIEIILGKVIPYIVLGYMQLTSILIFGKLLVHIPIEGSLFLLYLAAAPFIIANLMVGMIFSTLATTPMQASQLSTFYQLPSMFLSGYMFSYYGMPTWAQMIGACLPMTYFMRITRGILLKDTHWYELLPNILPIFAIALLLILITRLIFRKTLD